MTLRQQIKALVPEIVEAANQVLDEWDEDSDVGGGGVCDIMADRIATILSAAGIDTTEGGQPGDDHAYVVAYDDDSVYVVDIPAGVYEVGGGYSWRKRKGVVIDEDDVVIEKMPRSWLELDTDEY